MSVPVIPSGVSVTYNQQFRRCGKPDCPSCRPGAPGHGPYWYAYWREGGRLRSRYLGKHRPLGAAAASVGAGALPAPVAVGAPDALRVQMLGAFQVWHGDRPIAPERWQQRKAALLFKCLLSAPDLRLQRDQAVEWLWPEAPPMVGARNLHLTMYRLRQILDLPGAPHSHLRFAGDLLVLAPGHDESSPGSWCDAEAFSQAAAAALAGNDVRACRAALALYSGEYLPDDLYADWAIPRREALRRLQFDLLRHLADLCTAQGLVDEAIGALDTVLRVDPCHEATASALMRLLDGAGRRPEAMRVYQALTTALRAEFGLTPDASTRAVYLQMVEANEPALPVGTVTALLLRIAADDAARPRRALRICTMRLKVLDELIAGHAGSPAEQHAESADRCLFFTRASDALAAACAVQQASLDCAGEAARGPAAPWIRMAVHTGEVGAPLADGEHGAYDTVIARAARLVAAAHEGQILLSLATRALVRHTLPAGMRLRLLGAYRLPGAEQSEQVFQVLHPALPADFPPLRARRAHPTNVPAPLTTFIGREREQAAVAQALATGRLVTLAGAGGCGKTRLALQVAGTLLANYRDGVWLVELAGISDATLVPRTVAAALHVREEPGQTLAATLATQLQDKELLLVVDNCEHLVAACAELAALVLQRCPRLRLLATSREPLGIAGETVWRVPSLSLPGGRVAAPALVARPGDAALRGLDLLGYDAVQLFVERARVSQPSFMLTAHTAPLVLQVCRRLDGLPLAIELAAARLGVLSLEELAARLGDRFRLLTGGSRAALPRQQTLRATIDWSYSLLSDAERTLLRRLSIFAGGWTLEAAEAICAGVSPTRHAPVVSAGGGIDRGEVVELLAQLVAKSLVFVELQASQARYGMLETVRQYAAEHLVAGQEGAWVRRQHLAWCLALAEQARAHMQEAAYPAWLKQLDAEHDNIRAALGWAMGDAGDPATGVRLAAAMADFWLARGHLREGRRWLEHALDLLESAVVCLPIEDRAQVLTGGARLAHCQGDSAWAIALQSEHLAIQRRLGNQATISASSHNLGLFLFYHGEYDRAADLLEASLQFEREQGDRKRIVGSLVNLGMLSFARGDLHRAQALHEEGLAIAQALGDTQLLAAELGHLGLLAYVRDDHAKAAALFGRKALLEWERQDPRSLADALDGVAVAGARTDPERAATLFGATRALREALGAPLAPVYQTLHSTAIEAARTRLGDECFAECWAYGQALPLEAAVQLAVP